MADKDPLAGLPFPDEAQRMFSDPAFLEGAALIAAKHRRPEAAMKWLERASGAAKEGAFEAVGHLMADNPEEAINVWNRTGQYRDVVNVNKNKDGTYAISRKDGSTFNLDPVKEYKRFLSPREFMAYEQNEREGKDRATERQLTRDQWNRQFQQTQDWQRAQTERWDLDRADRLAIAEGNAALRALGGGSRSSRSSSGTGGAGVEGVEGSNQTGMKPKELQDLFIKYLEKTREKYKDVTDGRPTDEQIREEGVREFQAAFPVVENVKRGGEGGAWALRVPTALGQYHTLQTYNTKEEADKALQDLHYRNRPAQAPSYQNYTEADIAKLPDAEIAMLARGTSNIGTMARNEREARRQGIRKAPAPTAPPLQPSAGYSYRSIQPTDYGTASGMPAELERTYSGASAERPPAAPAVPRRALPPAEQTQAVYDDEAAAPRRPRPTAAIPPGNAGVPLAQQARAMAEPGYFKLAKSRPSGPEGVLQDAEAGDQEAVDQLRRLYQNNELTQGQKRRAKELLARLERSPRDAAVTDSAASAMIRRQTEGR